MGFECGFCRVHKYENATVEDVLTVKEYLSWRDSEYMRKYYKTFYDYCKEYASIDYSKIPSRDVIEYYSANKLGDYGEVEDTVEFWCSIGRLFDYFITSKLTVIHNFDDMYYEGITTKFLDELQVLVNEKLDKNKFVPARVFRAYTDSSSKCSTLIDCDGIEVEDESGNRKFVSKNDTILVCSSGFDYDEDYAYKKLDEVIQKLKKYLEDGDLIWYYRSE